MIKSIFVGLNLENGNYDDLGRVGANHLIVIGSSLSQKKWQMLKKMNCILGISLDCFGKDGCPSNPRAFKKLRNKIKKALEYKPDEIWLDHFRFDGRWESVRTKRGTKEYIYPNSHDPCRWCRGKNRSLTVSELAIKVKRITPNTVKVGYFAVPFKLGQYTKLASELGQDHSKVGSAFDIVSPMLYHRMIKKPIGYISEYVKYLHNLTNKPVLPIIQIKDMPDDLVDKLSGREVMKAYKEAIKPPSIGSSIFMWEHAVEKNKIALIKKVFQSS